MADLTAGQIPIVANVPNGGCGVIVGTANVAVMGNDANGVDIYVAGDDGGRVYALTGVTDDTVMSNILLWILDGIKVKPLGLINVAASAGNTLAAKLNIDFLSDAALLGMPLDNTGKRYIALLPNEKLRGGSLAGLTPSKSVWVTSQGSDYQP